MKITTVIDPLREEEVIIYVKEKNKLCEDIEALCTNDKNELIGYLENGASILDPQKVVCFFAEDGRVAARADGQCFTVKARLYQLEEQLPSHFIRINQSCIANIKMIKRFDSSLSGTLMVIFKDGHRDYVSRRNLKKVKERLGL